MDYVHTAHPHTHTHTHTPFTPYTLHTLHTPSQDLLLQIKERCSYIEKVNNLCKEIGDETLEVRGEGSPQSSHNPELAKVATEARDLNTRFSTMCLQAKQHYTDLSAALATVAGGRPLSQLSGQGGSSSKSGTLPAHLPPRSDKKSAVNLRKHSKLKRKKSKSLYIPDEEDGPSPATPGSGMETLESDPSSNMKKSRSVPTDLDELMSQKGGVASTDTPTSGKQDTKAPSKKTSLPSLDISSSVTAAINSNPAALRTRPDCLESPNQLSPSLYRHRDHSPVDSLRGSKRSRRPRSAVIVNGEEAQFCYLDNPSSPLTSVSHSPVLKVSPRLVSKVTANQTAVVHKISVGSEGQRSFGDSSSLSAMDIGSPSNQNASSLSIGSSLVGSNLSVDEWEGGGVESEGRRSKSMDELASVPGDGGDTNGQSHSRPSAIVSHACTHTHTHTHTHTLTHLHTCTHRPVVPTEEPLPTATTVRPLHC